MNETNGHHSSTRDTFKSFQVGITSPSPKQQSRRTLSNIPSVSISDDEQRTNPPTSPTEQDQNVNTHSSPSSIHNQNILSTVPITPGQRSSTLYNYEQGSLIGCFGFELYFYIIIHRMTTVWRKTYYLPLALFFSLKQMRYNAR